MRSRGLVRDDCSVPLANYRGSSYLLHTEVEHVYAYVCI